MATPQDSQICLIFGFSLVPGSLWVAITVSIAFGGYTANLSKLPDKHGSETPEQGAENFSQMQVLVANCQENQSPTSILYSRDLPSSWNCEAAEHKILQTTINSYMMETCTSHWHTHVHKHQGDLMLHLHFNVLHHALFYAWQTTCKTRHAAAQDQSSHSITTSLSLLFQAAFHLLYSAFVQRPTTVNKKGALSSVKQDWPLWAQLSPSDPKDSWQLRSIHRDICICNSSIFLWFATSYFFKPFK